MLQVIRIEPNVNTKEEFMDYLKKSSKKFNLVIQAIDPDLVLSKRQVKFAVKHAQDSFKNKKNRAKTLENEILLTLAMTRSFDQAIKILGIKNGEDALLIILGDNPKNFMKELSSYLINPVFKPDKEKILKSYGINKNSLVMFSLEDMLLEKMAIAANEK
ncbi:hypothetical protein HY570_03190 [Candidatus Micrarchaeota archaeon]|nr:hypothetical protein [Candidatus Micrarchaeota archaeon]